MAMVIMNPKYRLDEPGIGLGGDGWRVLTYDDLVSTEPQPYSTTVDREMTINITANMERYMFSFDGKKFSEHPGPYLFRYNERLRLFLVNHTMMEHPIHLHGMWMQLENGADKLPFKHTILDQTRRGAFRPDHSDRKGGLGFPLPPALPHGSGHVPGCSGRLKKRENTMKTVRDNSVSDASARRQARPPRSFHTRSRESRLSRRLS